MELGFFSDFVYAQNEEKNTDNLNTVKGKSKKHERLEKMKSK